MTVVQFDEYSFKDELLGGKGKELDEIVFGLLFLEKLVFKLRKKLASF